MSDTGPVLHVYGHIDSVCDALAASLADTANRATESRGAFHVVLAGGGTPRRLYARMPDVRADWSAWHIYFSDERHLPDGHGDRNDTMASQVWLRHVPVPPEHIHRVAFCGDVAEAARDYARVVRAVPAFDFTLLGIGEDGHTASLFPGRDLGELKESPAALPVHDAPKAPAVRVSMSVNRLNASRRIVFLVTGEAKRRALDALLRGAEIPAAAIRPERGRVEIFADAEAAG